MTDYSWLEPIQRETERIKKETERLREENKKLSKINDKEQFGHLPDGFLLNQEEIDDLKESKRELTEYGREKIKELIHKEQLRLTEDDLSDLLWLVRNYGDKLEKYPEENQVANLTTKLEKMLDEMG
jgi:hypothetical protein